MLPAGLGCLGGLDGLGLLAFLGGGCVFGLSGCSRGYACLLVGGEFLVRDVSGLAGVPMPVCDFSYVLEFPI